MSTKLDPLRPSKQNNAFSIAALLVAILALAVAIFGKSDPPIVTSPTIVYGG